MTTFMFGGTDTTAELFQMMIYLIAEHPEQEAKVRAMVREVIKSDKDITEDNLKTLTYIDWIQNETLRMYCPVAGILLR